MSDYATKDPSRNKVYERVAPAHGRLIRLPEVMDRVGMKRSAIYQRMREGRFPLSRSLGRRCAVWVEAEVDDWVNSVRRMPRGLCERTNFAGDGD
jgi:prophage regulatory protein